MSGVDPRRLSAIAAEMKALTNGDPEVSHSRADELLVEAIDRLSPYATETIDEDASNELVEAYLRLSKWYA